MDILILYRVTTDSVQILCVGGRFLWILGSYKSNEESYKINEIIDSFKIHKLLNTIEILWKILNPN